MHIVVIGGSASGLAFIDAFKKKNEEATVTLISEESILPYYRPELSHMIGTNAIGTKFFLKDKDYFENKNIDVRLGQKVVKIIRESKEVLLESGERLSYDKLILATGSQSFIPPVPGMDFKGVYALRTFEDLEKINAYMNNVDRIGVLGGGLLGIEAVWSLVKAGKKVVVTDLVDRLIPRQLDSKGSSLVQKELEKLGIICHLGVKSTVEGSGEIQGLSFSDGTREDCQMLLVSVGVRARIELALEAGLKCNRGILVDDYMQTSDKDIYAIGDVAEYQGNCSGIWPTAGQLGKMAAESLSTKQLPNLKTTPPVTILKALDIGVYSAGDVCEGEGKTDYIQDSRQRYMRLFFERETFVGVVVIGDTKISSVLYSLLMRKASREETMMKLELN